jgi:hypothetical protein
MFAIPPWTLHDLRRTFRTTLGRLKVRPDIAERLVNHVSARTEMEETYDLYPRDCLISRILRHAFQGIPDDGIVEVRPLYRGAPPVVAEPPGTPTFKLRNRPHCRFGCGKQRAMTRNMLRSQIGVSALHETTKGFKN